MRALHLALFVAIFTLAGAAPAAATFHEIWIREVYAGSILQPASDYIELQMWSSGQNQVAGHAVKTYDSNGNETSTNGFAQKVANGATQSTILLATAAATTEFKVPADTALADGMLDTAGGAVCWENLDCVAWGDFEGSLPSPAGAPAPAIPSGMALRRTIAPLCPTALDGGDDRNDSAADFSVASPAPRPNSVPPSETRCASKSVTGSSGGSGGSGSGGHDEKGAPQTTLSRKPRKRIRDRTPTFRFSSNQPGSTFQCKIDAKPFKRCKSPFTTKSLSFGLHTFKVRARNKSGHADPSPVSYSFKVIRRS